MKRFTETAKWEDPWFRRLTPGQKCLWIFLVDRCDHAGVWEVDRETAEHFIGQKLDWAKAIEAFRERIETLPGEKWRIVKFVQFQYGKLSGDCKPHNPVFQAMERHGLKQDIVESGLFSDGTHGKPTETLSLPFERVLDTDKDKEKGKDKAKDTETDKGRPSLNDWLTEARAAHPDWPRRDAESAWNYYEAAGWKRGKNPIIKWRACIATCYGNWAKNNPGRAASASQTAATSTEPTNWRSRIREISPGCIYDIGRPQENAAWASLSDDQRKLIHEILAKSP